MSSGSLGEFYRANGESEHLARLEAGLPVGWLSTRDVAVAAGVAAGGWTRLALEYLLEEGRAEKRRARAPQVGRGRRGHLRLEWRRPA